LPGVHRAGVRRVVNRALRFTLLGLAVVVVVTGCSGQGDKRAEWEAAAHAPAQVAACLRKKDRNVRRFLNRVYVDIRLQVTNGQIPDLSLEFYPTIKKARQRFNFLTQPSVGEHVRRIDNVVYDRPPHVQNPVFADIANCIRSSWESAPRT
jgi:hypothetical protein